MSSEAKDGKSATRRRSVRGNDDEPPVRSTDTYQRDLDDRVAGAANEPELVELNDDDEGRQNLDGEEEQREKVADSELPILYVQTKLEERVRQRRLLKDLLLHIPFVAAFIYFMFAHRHVSNEFFFTDAIRNYIVYAPLPPTNVIPGNANNTLPFFDKDYTGIGNFGDIYDWIETVLVNQFFTDDPAGRDPRNRYMVGSQNLLIGAIRIRAKRARNDSCPINPAWYPANESTFPRVCYGPIGPDGNEEKRPWTTPGGYSGLYFYDDSCTRYPLQWFYGQYAYYTCGGYNIDIPFTTSQSDARNIIAPLRKNQFFWITSLRLFIVEFVAYNPATDVFYSVKLPSEVTEGGGFLPWWRMRPFVVFDGSVGVIVYNTFFIGLILAYMYRFVLEWYRHGVITKSPVSYLYSVWNLMQLASLLLFIPTYVFWFQWVYYSNQVKKPQFDPPISTYPELLSTVSELYISQNYVNSVNCVLIILTFLKFAQLNNQLNILQRTVHAAIMPLLALLMIFVVVVLAYALAGNVIFGYSNAAYRTISFAFVSNFRALLGDFDYLGLWRTNRALAFFYFWTFILLGLFMMLNFIIAILMGAFGEEKAKTKSKSVAKLIQEAIESAKQTWKTRFKQYIMNLVSRKKMPDDILYDQMSLYVADRIRDLELSNDTEETIGDVGFAFEDFAKVVPAAELEEIGQDYMHALWYGIVDDYLNDNTDEADTNRQEAEQNVYEYSKEAIADYFCRFVPKMFDAREGDDQPQELQSLQSAVYTSSFANADATVEEEQNQIIDDAINPVRLRLKNGKIPTHLGLVVEEQYRRVTDLSIDMESLRGLYSVINGEFAMPDWVAEKPPRVPLYSGRPTGGPWLEALPDVSEARAKRNKMLKLKASIGGAASSRGSPRESSLGSGSTDDLETLALRSLTLGGITPPEFPGFVTSAKGKPLPKDGDWLETEADNFLWSRSRQCFLHLPSGHLAAEQGVKWLVPAFSLTQWITPRHRETLIVRSLSRHSTKSFFGTWPSSSMSLVPRPFVHVDHWEPLPRIIPNSTPRMGVWDMMPGYRGVFVCRDSPLMLNAVTGTFMDAATGLWYVPELRTWLPADQHRNLFLES